MRSIALLDTEWDRDDGLTSAPMPDSNVILRIPKNLEDVVSAAKRSVSVLFAVYGNNMPKAYMAIEAPKPEGDLYRHKSLFFGRHNSTFIVTPTKVLYVLECEVRGYRMIYDITNYF